jgi:hypothetical protein
VRLVDLGPGGKGTAKLWRLETIITLPLAPAAPTAAGSPGRVASGELRARQPFSASLGSETFTFCTAHHTREITGFLTARTFPPRGVKLCGRGKIGGAHLCCYISSCEALEGARRRKDREEPWPTSREARRADPLAAPRAR